MKKLFLISAILFVAMSSSFAFNPTQSKFIYAFPGDRVEAVVNVGPSGEFYIYLCLNSYGFAGVTDHKGIFKQIDNPTNYWVGGFTTSPWANIDIYACNTAGPWDPSAPNLAGILW